MVHSTHNHQQVAALTDTLRQLFRSRGLPYRVIAEKLGVTDRTVKRWLAGKGLTLPIVEDLCNILGLSFIEFCEFAKSDLDVRPNRLSPAQEQSLLVDGQLTFVFELLHRGWSPQEIQCECQMSEAILVGNLVRLEKLGLIELMPKNKVRLLFGRNLYYGEYSSTGKAFQKNMKHLFDSMDFTKRDAIWGCRALNLPVELLQTQFRSFMDELEKTADAERGSGAPGKRWYSILVAARPFDPVTIGEGRAESPIPIEKQST